MELSIDRRGEGANAVKISVAVRSLDGPTHSALTSSDREAISLVLSNAARAVEAIVTGQHIDAAAIQPAG